MAASPHSISDVSSPGRDHVSLRLIRQLQEKVEAMERQISEKEAEIRSLREASVTSDTDKANHYFYNSLSDHESGPRWTELQEQVHCRSLSPPNDGWNGALQRELWHASCTSPRVVENQGLEVRQAAWKNFCRKAKRELTEAELRQVNYKTLRKLLSLYKLDKSPVEAAHIELYWQELNGLTMLPEVPPPELPVVSPVKPATPEPEMLSPPENPRQGEEEVESPRSPSPKRPVRTCCSSHATSPSPKRSASSRLSRNPAILAPLDTPRKRKVQGPQGDVDGAGACVAQRWSASPQSTLRSPSRQGATGDMRFVGELHKESPVRQRPAPVGKANPNTIAEVKAAFTGEARPVNIPAVTESELRRVLGSEKGRKGRSKTESFDRAARDAARSARLLLRPGEAAPVRSSSLCNPNATQGPCEDLPLKPRGRVAHRGMDYPAASNPNATGAESPPPRSLSARVAGHRDYSPAACNPNTAGGYDDKDHVQPSRKQQGTLSTQSLRADSNPNTACGWEGEERRRRADAIDRREGDKVFRKPMGPYGTSGNPNEMTTGQPSVAHPRKAMVPGSPPEGRPGAVPIGEDPEFTHSRKQHCPPPAQRSGDAAHPILGTDGTKLATCGGKRKLENTALRESDSSPAPTTHRKHISHHHAPYGAMHSSLMGASILA